MGKPSLLKEFCADRPHVYFLAAQEAEERQREKFTEQVADAFDERDERFAVFSRSGFEDGLDAGLDAGLDDDWTCSTAPTSTACSRPRPSR